jgi:ribonucleoside-diphosphate reductase alpha chain
MLEMAKVAAKYLPEKKQQEREKMHVTKSNGSLEPVNLDKIVNSIKRVCGDLGEFDYTKIAIKTIGGLYDGVTTRELSLLSIQTAVGFIIEDPIYSKVAARLQAEFASKEVLNQEIHSFSQSIQFGYDNGLIGEEAYKLVMDNKRKLNAAVKPERDDLFEYFGIKTVYDRYLLKHPQTRFVFETPQYFFMRVAAGLSSSAQEVVEMYNLISSLEYMTSTPTLFNSGTRHSQMSSCYLLDSAMDDLKDIYKRYQDIALMSKFAGGIGVSASRIRSSGALIKGTNGRSNGIVPWLHTMSSSIAAVNQGGKRKGAACVYLETHHPDIMEFLELRDNVGEKEKRAYNLNLANWIPDLFMKRVEENGVWSMFDPAVAPELTDLFGDAYEARYLELETEGKYAAQLPAQKIYARMMKTLAETGNGWMCWKDASNRRCNSAVNGSVVHLSNLCTEIIEPTSGGKYATFTREQFTALTPEDFIAQSINVISYNPETDMFEAVVGGETAVCNLGSINIGRGYLKNGKLDVAKLHKNVATAVKYLDRVIDRNFYPIPEAKASNARLRPIGLGLMGLQDLFFQMRLPFDSDEAIALSAQIQEEIYYQALKTSVELAKEYGPHRDFAHTHAAKGLLQFDLAGVVPKDIARWDALKADIKANGLRNSLMIAIAPTATIAHITGAEECIEAQKANLLKRETLSGEFVAVNKYLVEDLKKLGRWNTDTINQLKSSEGSIATIPGLPTEIYALYKTVWEISQKKSIEHASARGAFIDQSQSLNLFLDLNKFTEDKRTAVLSSMYMYAWKKGLKTTYYLRGRSATKINKVTIDSSNGAAPTAPEDPETCESCT